MPPVCPSTLESGTARRPPLRHFWDRVRERTLGFTKQHVYQVLRKGTIQGVPEVDAEHNNYKVRVRASVIDFGTVEIVVGIFWVAGSVCITIYEKKQGV